MSGLQCQLEAALNTLRDSVEAEPWRTPQVLLGMPKLGPDSRALLAKTLADGVLAIVTHRNREEVPGSHEAWEDAEELCRAGYLHLDRISGDANNPAGERRYTYKLTPKGEREAAR